MTALPEPGVLRGDAETKSPGKCYLVGARRRAGAIRVRNAHLPAAILTPDNSAGSGSVLPILLNDGQHYNISNVAACRQVVVLAGVMGTLARTRRRGAGATASTADTGSGRSAFGLPRADGVKKAGSARYRHLQSGVRTGSSCLVVSRRRRARELIRRCLSTCSVSVSFERKAAEILYRQMVTGP